MENERIKWADLVAERLLRCRKRCHSFDFGPPFGRKIAITFDADEFEKVEVALGRWDLAKINGVELTDD